MGGWGRKYWRIMIKEEWDPRKRWQAKDKYCTKTEGKENMS